MKQPLVSVVVPCYNHEKYIDQCIQSIIDQDYKNIELIIIDDGSSDGSTERIKGLEESCKERFVRFEFRCRENKGLCATLNEAVQWCQGDYYSAIASDDVMLPFKTRIQVEHLQKNPECDAVFGGVNIIDDAGKITSKRLSKKGRVGFEQIILVEHTLLAPTQMLRLECLKKAGDYPAGLYLEDWYMWLKLSSDGSIFEDIGEVLVNYRRHETNVSAALLKMNAARIEVVNMYRAHPLYSKAKARVALSAAMDVQAKKKFASVPYALNALAESRSILGDIRFYRYLIKFIVPRKFIGRG
jgi:alpha-1,3-rhamnosyltransferase